MFTAASTRTLIRAAGLSSSSILSKRAAAPSSWSSAPFLTKCSISSISSSSSGSHVEQAQEQRQLTTKIQRMSLSSMPTRSSNDDNVLVMPPNLKIDPRAVSSPFYGLDRVEVDDDVDNDVEDDEEEEVERVLYRLEEGSEELSLPRAIPLPDRLTVPVYSFSERAKEDVEEEEVVGGLEVGTFFLAADVFGMDPIRVDLLQRCVVYQRNKKRGKRNAGAITKTIGQVSGSGKKVRQQKGSGSARAGHSRPAHWRGGAKAHGPKGKIQDYTTKLNKKVRKLALQHALSQKLLEGNLIVVDQMSLDTHKTNVLAKTLQQLGDIGGKDGTTAYLLDDAQDNNADDDDDDNSSTNEMTSIGGVNINVKVASGNLFQIKLDNQRMVNVYDILKHEKLVLSLNSITALEKRLA